MKLSDPVTSSMVWASDAYAYVCSTVMPDGASTIEGTDLSGDYYTSALPIVQLQIAKAGYRYDVLIGHRGLGAYSFRLAA